MELKNGKCIYTYTAYFYFRSIDENNNHHMLIVSDDEHSVYMLVADDFYNECSMYPYLFCCDDSELTCFDLRDCSIKHIAICPPEYITQQEYHTLRMSIYNKAAVLLVSTLEEAYYCYVDWETEDVFWLSADELMEQYGINVESIVV